MEETASDSTEKKAEDSSVKRKGTDEKLKYDNINNEQELLGSVTTINNPGLRTSARVIQKMKQDSIRPLTPPPIDKKDTGIAQRTASQTRTPKVIWSNYEKNVFFDGLNEFGKDFESISNFINSKIKRKSVADQPLKTKEQIRQFYYQTYHKLSKYLKFSDDVKKPAQELYALINYGEMRRKLVFVSEKNCMKMKDLVYKGHVTVRSKGKNIRLKTPPCKALRKLNQLDDWQEDINLPHRIEIVLKPANMEAWGRVQSIAQNPLVRTTVPLQKKLINVIKTFQQKWRDDETKLVHQSLAISKQTNNSAKQDTKASVDCENSGHQEPLLCLCPPSDVVIHKPLISVTEFLSSFNICLNSYEQKIGVKVRGETLCNKRQRSDSGSEKKSPESKKVKTETEPKLAETNGENNRLVETNGENVVVEIEEKEEKEKRVDFSEISSSNQSNDECPEVAANDANINHTFLRQDSSDGDPIKKSEVLISNSNDNAVSGFAVPPKPEEVPPEVALKLPLEVKVRKKELKCTGKRKDSRREVSNLKPLLDEETEKRLRKGWTVLNASDISVGDLYITLGHDSKITLEYYWIKNEVEVGAKREKSSLPYNINNVDEDSAKLIKTSKVSNRLRHLLLIANLSERIKRKPCSCGHICEKGLKNKRADNEGFSKTFVSNKTYKTAEDDNVFRQPVAPFRRQMHPMDNVRLIQSAFRYNQSRMMVRSRTLAPKQVVVQRLLPVQPGINQSYDVVAPQVHVRTIVSDSSSHLPAWTDRKSIDNGPIGKKRHDFTLKESNGDEETVDNSISTVEVEVVNITETPQKADLDTNGRPFMVLSTDELGILKENGDEMKENSTTKITNIDEDPGIQQLMEISLPSPAAIQCLDDSDSCSIPPMSPMRLIRDAPSDPKWLEENLNDFSLSSFLGHLDDMNRDLDSMSVMSDSSQDYMSKFAEIAASIQNEEKDL